jgi:hypothetical protein
MKRLRSLAVLALIAATALGAASKPQFDKHPPGQIVQDSVAYLSGEAMNSAWHVVTSRKMLGRQMGKEPAYQWYVSFYAPAAEGLKLVYQLPGNNDLMLAKVEKASGAELYFPRADVKIVGTGEFEQSGVQDVVLQVMQSAADCGSAKIIVFGADKSMKVVPRVHVQNGCDLRASIVKNGPLAALQLSGPYYSAHAPLCCPTKPHATALLSFQNGTWTEKPSYFTIMRSSASAHHSAGRSIHR